MNTTACFVSASRQNVFFGELLEALAQALMGMGIAIEHSVDCFPQLRKGLVYVFVPHELLPLTQPEVHPTPRQLRRSVAICTEQPGTAWFEEDARVAEKTALALDINRLGVHALRKRGVDARLLQLGYISTWDAWGGRDEVERPIHLNFQGGATPRRLQAIGRCASRLAGRYTELHLVEGTLPHGSDSRHFVAGNARWDMLRRSRLMLNIHRGELGYLEWQRIVGAIANGCVVLSEHSVGFEPLVPGEHFASVSYDALEFALDALLDDEDRLSRMRQTAYAFLRDQLPLSTTAHTLAEAVTDVACKPMHKAELRRTFSHPSPRSPDLPHTEYERILTSQTDLDIVRMALKQVLLDQRALRERVERMELHVTDKKLDAYEVEAFGPEQDIVPQVSVVISVYNYATLVGEAIASVAASRFDDYEMVIVDDASRDGSGAAVREALAAAPWATARVVTRAHNRGLARARNLGVELSQGSKVFILDADNGVYPNALGRLAQALDEHPEVEFVYGIIERFGARCSSGLMSYLGWDPLRLRYGNYVDAMSMIRRSALIDVGGYVTDPRLYGWEDFALWCKLAEQGSMGLRVPEIVARYRVSLHSMISVTNIDAAVAWGVLVDMFPFLVESEQALDRA